MKLLPKTQINTLVQSERAEQVKSGVFIAKKIDALREEMLQLQKSREDFIAGSQDALNNSLAVLHQKVHDHKKEIETLEIKRKELLKPLDTEWTKLNKESKSNTEQKEKNRIDREQLNSGEQELKQKEKEISQLATKTRYQATETEKARTNAFALEEMAQRKYEIAAEEHTAQTVAHEKAMSEVNQKCKEYENGIVLYTRKSKDLEERETQLLLDKQHLESQQRQLRIAKEILEKNATTN